MKRKVRFFVEGIADEKFIRDYISFLCHNNDGVIDIYTFGNWTQIPKIEPKFKENTDSNGINLLIVDADDKPVERRDQVLKFIKEFGIEFELFLMPNNNDPGNIETLLCEIMNPNHKMIFDCFDKYQDCLKINTNYFLPNFKSKIYAYLEALLPGKQHEMIKDHKRDYKNSEHWILSNSFLIPLKNFLLVDGYEYFLED